MRDDGAIPNAWWGEAVVAAAAVGVPRSFAEVIKKAHPPTAGGFTQAYQCVEFADRDTLVSILPGGLVIIRRCCTMSARP